MPTPSPNTAISRRTQGVGKQSLSPINKPRTRFPAQVVLKRQYLEKRKRFPVSAGQSVSVNFIVRDKP